MGRGRSGAMVSETAKQQAGWPKEGHRALLGIWGPLGSGAVKGRSEKRAGRAAHY